MSQHVRILMRYKSNGLIFGAIILCAGFILAMPFVPTIRGLWIKAMHGRIDDAPTMMAVQVVPKMYNFANRVAITDVPLTPEQLDGLPMSLPFGGEYMWMNHYPSWVMTSYPLNIVPSPEESPKYLYLLSKWRGVDTVTGYKIVRGEQPKGFAVELLILEPSSTTPSPAVLKKATR